jgi:malonyl CoA-acyl carrier protein transacylase
MMGRFGNYLRSYTRDIGRFCYRYSTLLIGLVGILGGLALAPTLCLNAHPPGGAFGHSLGVFIVTAIVALGGIVTVGGICEATARAGRHLQVNRPEGRHSQRHPRGAFSRSFTPHQSKNYNAT